MNSLILSNNAANHVYNYTLQLKGFPGAVSYTEFSSFKIELDGFNRICIFVTLKNKEYPIVIDNNIKALSAGLPTMENVAQMFLFREPEIPNITVSGSAKCIEIFRKTPSNRAWTEFCDMLKLIHSDQFTDYSIFQKNDPIEDSQSQEDLKDTTTTATNNNIIESKKSLPFTKVEPTYSSNSSKSDPYDFFRIRQQNGSNPGSASTTTTTTTNSILPSKNLTGNKRKPNDQPVDSFNSLLPSPKSVRQTITSSTPSKRTDTKPSAPLKQSDIKPSTKSTIINSITRYFSPSSSTLLTTYSNPSPTKGKKIRNEQGFKNLGNTCFMNSVLQSFFGSNEIVKDLKSHELKIHLQKENKLYPVLMTLLSKREDQDIGYFSLSTGIDTRKFKEIIDTLTPKFKGYMQHDAQEFLITLLDILEEELKKEFGDQIKRLKQIEKEKSIGNGKVNGNEKENGKENGNHTIKKEDDEEKDNGNGDKKKKQEFTKEEMEKIVEGTSRLCPVTKNLKSTITNTFTCTLCKDKSKSREIFTDISLDIPQGTNTNNIQELLDNYLKKEVIERKCPNPSCENQKSTVQKHFSQIPKILVLHLKRFVQIPNTAECLKDQTIVFPSDTLYIQYKDGQDQLSIKNETKNDDNSNGADKEEKKVNDDDYENPTTSTTSTTTTIETTNIKSSRTKNDKSKNDNKFKEAKYSLYSAIEHIGSGISSGHYISYLKQSKQYWKRYDDSDVSEVSEEDVFEELMARGYLYFYQLEEPISPSSTKK